MSSITQASGGGGGGGGGTGAGQQRGGRPAGSEWGAGGAGSGGGTERSGSSAVGPQAPALARHVAKELPAARGELGCEAGLRAASGGG